MKVGKIYSFEGGKAYIEDTQKKVVFSFKTKEFLIVGEKRHLRIFVYPYYITNKKVIKWIKSWAASEDKIVTPGGRTISLDGKIVRKKTEFIYFIFNKDSNAVKIGRAKNVYKRLRSLQTGSPVKLKLLKIIDLKAGKEARETEHLFHDRFKHLRLLGEWFKFELELQLFIRAR